MQGGDLSNQTPPRLVVTWEALTEPVTEERRFLGIKVGTTESRRIVPSMLLYLWRYTERAGVIVELVNFGVDQTEADRRLGVLDRRGANPMNYTVVYDDIEELIADLPYRPDVIGVLDQPANQARYGGLGIGVGHLNRIF
jgi:hypothetical protein